MVKKVVLRSLLKEKWIFLAINVLIFMTLFLSTLALFSYFIGLGNVKTYNEIANVEDFEFNTIKPLSNDQLDDLEQKYNIRIEKNNFFNYFNENKSIKIYKYNENLKINKVQVTKGNKQLKENEILIGKDFANKNNIKINDYININNIKLKVIGYSFHPEDTYAVKENDLLPKKDAITTGFVNERTYNNLINKSSIQDDYIYRVKFNNPKVEENFYESFQNEYKIKLPKQNILGIQSLPLEFKEYNNIINIVKYRQNLKMGILYLEYLAISIIMLAMSFIIGLITIILTIFLFKSIIQKQKRDLGILIASGTNKNQIANQYFKIFSISIIIVFIISTISSYFAFLGFNNLLEEFFNFIKYPTSLSFIIYCLIIFLIETFILIMAVNYFAIKPNLNIKVLDMIYNTKMIKPKGIKAKKRKSNLSFSNKLKVNTLIRNKGKTILLIYGVAFSSFLILFSFLMLNGFVNMKQNLYGDEFSYNVEAVYSKDFKPAPTKYNDESIIYFISQIDDKEIPCVAYNVNNKYININNNIELKNNEVYITSALAKNLKVQKGDVIQIKNPLDLTEKYNLKVKEIADSKAEEKIYLNINFVHNKFNLNNKYYNGIVTKDKTKEQISQGDKKLNYYSTDDLIVGINQYSKMLNFAIFIICFLALLISIIGLLVVTNIIIKNNEKIISIMKVLGYSNKEINSYILSGYKYIVVITYIIMYPLSIIGAKAYLDFILNLVEDLNYPIVLEGNFKIFFVGLILIFFCYEVSLIFTKRRVAKVKLSKTLNIDE